MFWQTSVIHTAVGYTCRGYSMVGNVIKYVVVEARQGLGAREEYLVEIDHVWEKRNPGDVGQPYTGPGAYEYAWVEATGPSQFRANPNYAPPTPSTPPGSPSAGGTAGAASNGNQGSGRANTLRSLGQLLHQASINQLLTMPSVFSVAWDDAPDSCAHSETVDSGMGSRYCKHCPATLRFIDMEWVADAK